ncbi:MAG: hypothetical protein MZV64_13410 [Ignavibacteriales bacterium]|nr:hypothetical protein [Ignavibacteriales bacterium]
MSRRTKGSFRSPRPFFPVQHFASPGLRPDRPPVWSFPLCLPSALRAPGSWKRAERRSPLPGELIEKAPSLTPNGASAGRLSRLAMTISPGASPIRLNDLSPVTESSSSTTAFRSSRSLSALAGSWRASLMLRSLVEMLSIPVCFSLRPSETVRRLSFPLWASGGITLWPGSIASAETARHPPCRGKVAGFVDFERVPDERLGDLIPLDDRPQHGVPVAGLEVLDPDAGRSAAPDDELRRRTGPGALDERDSLEQRRAVDPYAHGHGPIREEEPDRVPPVEEGGELPAVGSGVADTVRREGKLRRPGASRSWHRARSPGP